MRVCKFCFSVIGFVMLIPFNCFGQFLEGVVIEKSNSCSVEISQAISVAVDSNVVWDLDQVLKKNDVWTKSSSSVLTFAMTNYAHWCKIEIENYASDQYIKLAEPMIDEIDLFFVTDSGLIKHSKSGSSYMFNDREIKVNDYLFNLPQGSYTCYIRLKSNLNLQVPIGIASLKYFMEDQQDRHVFLAMYFGLMLIMLFYNFFIYLSVRDETYLYYIFNILFVVLTYACFEGFSFQYLWNEMPYLNFLIPSFSSVATVFMSFFVMSFLQTKIHIPKFNNVLWGFIWIFIVCVIINLMGNYQLSATISQPITLLFSVYLILIGVKSHIRGVKVARFFLLAWTLFLISIIIYILQMNAVISYNTFTSNSIYYGSAIEVTLLSFALANRINIMRAEKETAQEGEIQAVLKMRDMAEEDAKTLQFRVDKATLELKISQGQLVQSEKMNSLGRMAAGVAHEINNSINISNNYISVIDRNVSFIRKYLNQIEMIDVDMDDVEFKLREARGVGQEIEINELFEELTNSILQAGVGIKRTVEITAGLRYFSKIDTNTDVVLTNINKDLSAMVLLQRSFLPESIKIELDLGEIPDITCKAKSFNMAFLSVFENAVLAIKDKTENAEDVEGLIKIQTRVKNDQVIISFNDNGVGIDSDVLPLIFEPFFTTRPVGNRGLGLSSAYGTVKEHKGEIEVYSEKGRGSTFKILFPLKL